MHYARALRKLEKMRQMMSMEYPNIFGSTKPVFIILLLVGSFHALNVPSNLTYFGDMFVEDGYIYLSIGEPHNGIPIYNFSDEQTYWGLFNTESRYVVKVNGSDVQNLVENKSSIYVYSGIPDESDWWLVLLHEINHAVQPELSEQEVCIISRTYWCSDA